MNGFLSYISKIISPFCIDRKSLHPLLQQGCFCVGEDHFVAGTLEQLSLDIVIEIVSFLDRIEFIQLSTTNRFFKRLTEDRRFWLLDHHDIEKKLFGALGNLSPVLTLERIKPFLKSDDISFKEIFKNLILAPFPCELNQVQHNLSSVVHDNHVDLIPETKRYIALFGQPHSGKYSLGIYSTQGFKRPSARKSIVNMDFFFKKIVLKMENLTSHKVNISGISKTSFEIESIPQRNIRFGCKNRLTLSMNSFSPKQDNSIMYTIDLAVRNNNFLKDLSTLLETLFQINIEKDNPQIIRKKMENTRLCIIGTKSDVREMSPFTLAQQLMKLIDVSCEFWDQSIIYIETSSKLRENMDLPYLFFAQSRIHAQIHPSCK